MPFQDRPPFVEPVSVTSMPYRTLIFFDHTAYDLLATMNSIYGDYVRGEVSQQRWDILEPIFLQLRWEPVPEEDIPMMPHPTTRLQGLHFMLAEEWFDRFGVVAGIEDEEIHDMLDDTTDYSDDGTEEDWMHFVDACNLAQDLAQGGHAPAA